MKEAPLVKRSKRQPRRHRRRPMLRSRRRADHLGDDIAREPGATADVGGVVHLYRPAVRDSADVAWLTVHDECAGLSGAAYIVAATGRPLTCETLDRRRPGVSGSDGSRCRHAHDHIGRAVRPVRPRVALGARGPRGSPWKLAGLEI